MPLPPSGPLSISQIRNEAVAQGYPSSYSLRQLSVYAGFGTPDAISEFYGWPPCPPAGTYLSQYCSGCALIYVFANGSCGSYDQVQDFNSPVCGCGTCCDCGFGCECSYSQPCWQIGCIGCR